MRLLLILAILVLSSCDAISALLIDTSSIIEPIPVVNQKGFAGEPSENAFFTSTFEYDDLSNYFWWEGNIGIQQAGILSGKYSLFVNGLDSAVYGYVDTPSPTIDYEIQYSASTGYGAHEANQYGIIFDYRDASNYGLFVINGYGEYALGYFENNDWRPIATGTTDINVLKRSFVISVAIINNQIHPTLNDLEFDVVPYPKELIGTSGIYLGSRASDTASLLVSEFSISPVE